MNKAERQALKRMSGQAQGAYRILEAYEKQGFGAVPELCRALEAEPITFLAFSCLGTYKGKEQLRLDLGETFFFRKFIKPARRLFRDLSIAGIAARLVVVLPDTEPRETWKWSVPQDELSGLCRMMAEDATASLPGGWEVVLWSDLAEQGRGTFEKSLEWANQSASPLLIREEAEHIRTSAAFDEILVQDKPARVALRQVAAYAWQGQVLEHLYPDGILLQSEFPAGRKDRMYQPLRTRPMPIIHPFEL